MVHAPANALRCTSSREARHLEVEAARLETAAVVRNVISVGLPAVVWEVDMQDSAPKTAVEGTFDTDNSFGLHYCGSP